MSSATFAAPATKPRKASSVADAVIVAAVDVAHQAAVEAARPNKVGAHQGVKAEGTRLATHYFASASPGYQGWRWAVTLARAPRAKVATVCEVCLLPGDGAIIPPPWVPWSERLEPGDVGPTDLLPFVPDDPRLEQGYEETGDDDADRLAIFELGLGRPRVLSPEGRAEAATRWYESDHGPVAVPAVSGGRGGGRRSRPAAPAAQCSTCGFLLQLAGSLRGVFGVCANEWSPDDGRVVSLDHGCGSHSETDIDRSGSDWPENAPVIDDHGLEMVDHASADSAETETGAETAPVVAAEDVTPDESRTETASADGPVEAPVVAATETPATPTETSVTETPATPTETPVADISSVGLAVEAGADAPAAAVDAPEAGPEPETSPADR